MLYAAYQAHDDIMSPVRGFAGAAARALASLPPGVADQLGVRTIAASYEMLSRAQFTHERPPFGITSVRSGGRAVQVEEQVADATPFCSLLHFAKDTPSPGPRVLLVAPLSGHFSTLVRETVRTMLRDHDVYLTDWHNARDVPVAAGRFGLDEYTDHVIAFLGMLGPGAHVVAVCQPCVPVLAASAVMAARADPARPSSMTLMAGPIDARVSPTAVNELATSHPVEWFEQHVLDTVPGRYAGGGRRVYPGFLQVTAFLRMNPQRHLRSHMQLYRDLVSGDTVSAQTTKTFYDEYFAVLDMASEFYLETVERVFQEFALAAGTYTHHGEIVDPTCITRTALLTIVAERDDVCGVGQTLAAHDLCTRLKPFRKKHHLQAGVGHYGVFSGRRW
ncbi:MAG TPA: polyhydroxyalkanoate depolymerase, partial [Acidimicrobiia bacterium]|nr:polyhydroxyalkanoate depolymerase [Acidimicrobiia bacterium]